MPAGGLFIFLKILEIDKIGKYPINLGSDMRRETIRKFHP